MKLFSKSFGKRRLFKKRWHPKAFIIPYQGVVFRQSSNGCLQENFSPTISSLLAHSASACTGSTA
ncbi:hypothetical protein CXP35_16020 (plasmid) [Komagataeibacter xylinus]|nr:hypothetical protein CXP35_16020 [Komagataeibacter xylinus]